jgi:hypothetical protein
MRTAKLFLFIVDGGATPKNQLKSIIEDGCTEEGYSYVEYPVDSSGDISLYYKVTKD